MDKSVTKNKIIFWDVDGTLAEYRFNNHLGDPEGTDNGMSMAEILDGVFLNRKPSKHMQNVVNTSEAKEHIVLGHTMCEKETLDKHIWLDRYYPQIEKRLFIGIEESKADTILEYTKAHNIDINQVIFVDDIIRIAREAERKGITSYHISSFLDWEYNK